MKRLSEQLREAIEEEIAVGKLPPGSRLDEVGLARRFNVSRTPIREALGLLRGEGLIEVGAQRGAVVIQLKAEQLVEMFEVMAELEAMCARLGMRRMTDADFAALEAAHEGCRVAAGTRDSDAYFYANEKFHFAIYASAHNQFLAEQALALQRRLRPYRRLQLRVRDRVQRSFEEHQSIVDAMGRGDSEAVVACVRGHVVVQGARFGDLIATLSQFDASAPTLPEPDNLRVAPQARRNFAQGLET